MSSDRSRRPRLAAIAVVGAAGLTLGFSVVVTWAIVLPQGFQEEVVLSGLSFPTNVEFAPDGRIFVAEKSGVVKVFDGVADTTPTILADLSLQVHDFWDRGLLGLAVDPQFPASPYVYVLYTYNFDPNDPGAGFPRWPDSCPSPPGATDDGCVVNGRLSRLEVGPGNTLVGGEQVLVENRWCQQYPSHSLGDLAFDGVYRVLYASAGEGANFNYADYGQGGGSAGSPTPANPCGDPDTPRGTAPSPPGAEGGALRAQDFRSGGDEVGFNGTILRLDPDTGLAPPSNPLAGGDPGDDPIVAHGLRNPFRIAARPGTSEVWVGDPGWAGYEEIDRIVDGGDALVENFGWPCYEGPARQATYDGSDLALCEDLYADLANPARAPFFAYQRADPIDTTPVPFRCTKTGSSSIAGLAFYSGTVYPLPYRGALFFADYSRDCLFVISPGADGLPDVATRDTFANAASNPVDLEVGPDGLLYWVDFDGGRLLRVTFFRNNTPPVAAVSADRTDGALPLVVQFDGSDSSDPDPDDSLLYEWDLDADGQFDDSTAIGPSFTYTEQGAYLVGLRVTDIAAVSDVAQISILAGNTRPAVTIAAPGTTPPWKVGDEMAFQGSATDAEDGPLPPAALHWEIFLQHCPAGTPECHSHLMEEHDGVDAGTVTAPDHEWFTSLEFVLTATDTGFPGGGGGVLAGEARRTVNPQSVDLAFASDPPGLQLLVAGAPSAAPFARQAIVGASVPIVAISPQTLAGCSYDFASWSDGGAAGHTIVAPENTMTLVATYTWAGTCVDWWHPAWNSRHRLGLNNLSGAENLVDFPVLVSLDSSRIDLSRTSPGGVDLRFVDADGVTLLPHEIERWDPTGVSLVWVKVPQVDAGSQTDSFWLYHDNPTATEATLAPSDVWSAGYVGVWHLGDDLLDSSPLANDGMNHGSTPAFGRIGGGRLFDGSSWIDAGSDPSLAGSSVLTLEAWVKVDDPNRDAALCVLSKKSSWDSAFGYGIDYQPLQNRLRGLSSGADSGEAIGVDLDGQWHYLATKIDGVAATLWVDGVERTTDPSCAPLAADAQALHLGRRSGGTDYFFGGLDEIRVASASRSSAWVAAQHVAMTDGYLSYGPSEIRCGASDATCNAIDDDCDGTADDDAVPPPSIGNLAVDPSALSWAINPVASSYQVVRGDAAVLRTTNGDFAQATVECLAAAVTGGSIRHSAVPGPAMAHWFLVRGINCAGAGTYDTVGSGQIAPRDAKIALSAAACP